MCNSSTKKVNTLDFLRAYQILREAQPINIQWMNNQIQQLMLEGVTYEYKNIPNLGVRHG